MTRVPAGLLAILLSLVAGAISQRLTAQQPPQLAPGQRVRVTAPSAHLNVAIATVTALSARDITLELEWTRGDTMHLTVPLDSLHSVDVSAGQSSHGLEGAVIGGSIGGIAGLIVGKLTPCEGFGPCLHELYALPGLFLGAVLGGGIGAGVHAEKWVSVPLRRLRVGLVPQPPGRLGLVASLAF